MDVSPYKEALLASGELLGGSGLKPLQSTMDNNNGRQGDMADQASGNNETHIQLKLKQTDAKILQAIEERSSGSTRAPTACAATAASPSRRPG